jgi:hypothetical protein
MIPYAMTYTSTMSGQLPKLVNCEGCHQQYVYLVQRTATCEDTSMLFLDNAGAKSRAQAGAEQSLIEELTRAIEPIPCPRCGHIQQHMFESAGMLKYAWVDYLSKACYVFALISFLAGFFGFMFSSEPRSTIQNLLVCGGAISTVILIGSGIGLSSWKKRLSRTYNPNSEPLEDRLTRGKTQAYLVDMVEGEAPAAEATPASEPAKPAQPVNIPRRSERV